MDGLGDLVDYLVDLGDYQAVGLADLVDRDELDLLANLQVLKVLIPLLVPMEG